MTEITLSKVTDFIKDGLDKYSDTRDLLKEEVLENEAIELIGDCSKVAKLLVGTKKLFNISMFSFFLKGLYIGNQTEEEVIDKLREYINDEDKAMFISKTIDNILNSKSKYSVFILGYMVNTLLRSQQELHPKYIILANALTNMFDHEIESIRFMGDYCNYKIYDERKLGRKKINKNKRDIYFYKRFKEILEENNFDKDILYLTIEKCIANQLMIKNVESYTELDLNGLDVSYDKEIDDEPDISTGSASANTEVEESYEMTIIGEFLYELTVELDIKYKK